MDTKEIRRGILKMGLAAKSQGVHMGGSLSLVEIMAVLSDGTMPFNPADPSVEYHDRLIPSKGDGVMAQYAALKQLGLLTEEEVLSYKANGSRISAHPAVNTVLGIDFASGSLGQGLSLHRRTGQCRWRNLGSEICTATASHPGRLWQVTYIRGLCKPAQSVRPYSRENHPKNS